jgi:hypothetical protein
MCTLAVGQTHSSAASDMGRLLLEHTTNWVGGNLGEGEATSLEETCDTGELRAQTSEAFTRDYIQISKSSALTLENTHKLMLFASSLEQDC